MKKQNNFNIKKIFPYFLYFLLILLISILAAVSITKFLSVSFSGLTDGQMALIAGISQSCAAIISVCLLVYQLKDGAELNEQQRNIDEAQFILQYNRAIIENPDMVYVEHRLEMFSTGMLKEGETIIVGRVKYQHFVNYLVYFEGLALSVLREEIRLDRIDDLMGYRFFLIMNNPDVSKAEIRQYPDYYKGCISLYKIWKKHREDAGKPIPLSEYSLDSTWEKYSQYANKLLKQ